MIWMEISEDCCGKVMAREENAALLAGGTVPHVEDCSASNGMVGGGLTTAADDAPAMPVEQAATVPHVFDLWIPKDAYGRWQVCG